MHITTTYPIKTQTGFTLIELMITIAIIGILAAIAIPSYQNYTRKAAYSEVVNQTSPYKIGVMECYHLLGNFEDCNSGKNSVPAAITNGPNVINNLQVDNGKITVIPNHKNGITPDDTYILTPELPNTAYNFVTWHSSGGGVERGYAK